MGVMEDWVSGSGSLVDSWRHRGGIVRCMRYLHGPAAQAGIVDDGDKYNMEESMNPPLALIAGAAATYVSANMGLRRAVPSLLTRPLVLQLAACAPAGFLIVLGGLSSCHSLLLVLARPRGGAADGAGDAASPLGRELRARCGDALLPPSAR
mmetsp:Transcript_70460/g.198738  ORF Transcript_70460/g.198738 Transcript_70460/m.198738 type:complete len:152 (+) Transcript_70460:54-509(+)